MLFVCSSDISGRCVLVQLIASVEVLTARVSERAASHFMPASLVLSQLTELELLEDGEWPCLTYNVISNNIETATDNIRQFIYSLSQLTNF